MHKKRFFEYFHNHPDSLIPKIVREIYEIVAKPSWLKKEEELKNKSSELLRQSLYLASQRTIDQQRMEELLELTRIYEENIEESKQHIEREYRERIVAQQELATLKTDYQNLQDKLWRLQPNNLGEELTTQLEGLLSDIPALIIDNNNQIVGVTDNLLKKAEVKREDIVRTPGVHYPAYLMEHIYPIISNPVASKIEQIKIGRAVFEIPDKEIPFTVCNVPYLRNIVYLHTVGHFTRLISKFHKAKIREPNQLELETISQET